ncbi:predicted protein [Sclerotinia sclerotiorum 1980 UF-70]|uniref:Uncharacterized protein n=1 Tax=Sclerotinia sclerotiorum (strain ATCC 18683 / 1980 / Ss-1) TaxID=665079 RepID=A7EQM5_SCLS1|nr:predicted protein [Sclerotinia sclerotiorum 1980 UF-70]EDN91767.1 predicted protein [Sclerotinia sclerotiorum 1980 UF-70]
MSETTSETSPVGGCGYFRLVTTRPGSANPPFQKKRVNTFDKNVGGLLNNGHSGKETRGKRKLLPQWAENDGRILPRPATGALIAALIFPSKPSLHFLGKRLNLEAFPSNKSVPIRKDLV